jgi:hypothetical protein
MSKLQEWYHKIYKNNKVFLEYKTKSYAENIFTDALWL